MLYKNKYRIESARCKTWDYSSDGSYFITICTHDRNHYFGTIVNGIMALTDIGKIAKQFWGEIPHHFPMVHLDEWVIMPNHVHGIITIDKTMIYPIPDSAIMGIDGEILGGIRGDCVDYRDYDDRGIRGDCGDYRGHIDGGIRGNCVGRGYYNDRGICRDKAVPCLYGGNNDNENDNNDNGDNDKNDNRNTNAHKNHNTNTNINIAKPPTRFQNQGIGTISAIVGSYKSICTKTINKSQNAIRFAWQPRFHDHIIRNDSELNRIRQYIVRNPMNWNGDKFYSSKKS